MTTALGNSRISEALETSLALATANRTSKGVRSSASGMLEEETLCRRLYAGDSFFPRAWS